MNEKLIEKGDDEFKSWTYVETQDQPIEFIPETEYKGNRTIEISDVIQILIHEGIIHFNSHWWRKEWSEEHRKLVYIGVNCNDVFAWACSDSEEANYDELYELWDYWKKDPALGHWIWCIKKRNELPQKPVYDYIMKQGIWDLDSMGLEPNYYDEMLRKDNEKPIEVKQYSIGFCCR